MFNSKKSLNHLPFLILGAFITTSVVVSSSNDFLLPQSFFTPQTRRTTSLESAAPTVADHPQRLSKHLNTLIRFLTPLSLMRFLVLFLVHQTLG